jgi:hypothetical protein
VQLVADCSWASKGYRQGHLRQCHMACTAPRLKMLRHAAGFWLRNFHGRACSRRIVAASDFHSVTLPLTLRQALMQCDSRCLV